jgi:hypothetical protein
VIRTTPARLVSEKYRTRRKAALGAFGAFGALGAFGTLGAVATAGEDMDWLLGSQGGTVGPEARFRPQRGPVGDVGTVSGNLRDGRVGLVLRV